MKVSFTVLGEPQGKGRPRFSRATGRTYTPDKTAAYENLVKLEYESQCRGQRFADGEMLDRRIFAYYGIPQSASKKRKALMLDGIIRPTKKPDMDNVVKVIADSLNNVAYKDDTQIVDAMVRKFYSDTPRVKVVIHSIQNEQEKGNEMNKVFLTGYIDSEIELKATPQGTPVVTFQLAVKRPRTKNDVTDFITVVCWRSTAEFVSRYFRKGGGIEVSGVLTVRKWKDKSGNNRYSTEVVADDVDFGKKSKDDKPQAQGMPQYAPPSESFEELSDDDDLPF